MIDITHTHTHTQRHWIFLFFYFFIFLLGDVHRRDLNRWPLGSKPRAWPTGQLQRQFFRWYCIILLVLMPSTLLKVIG